MLFIAYSQIVKISYSKYPLAHEMGQGPFPANIMITFNVVKEQCELQ